MRLNGVVALKMSAPFYFPLKVKLIDRLEPKICILQDLCLSNVDIKLYDFSTLLRSTSHTLTHLSLERVRIIDAAASNDALLQLERIRALNTLRIDAPLTEVSGRRHG